MITAVIWFTFGLIFLGVMSLLIGWSEHTKSGYKFIRSIGKLFFDIDVDEVED